MSILATAFVLSLITTLLLVRFSHLHEKFSADHDLNGVQKFHAVPVPRIGGLSLIIGMCGALWLRYVQNETVGTDSTFGLMLLISAFPAFGFGCLEGLANQRV